MIPIENDNGTYKCGHCAKPLIFIRPTYCWSCGRKAEWGKVKNAKAKGKRRRNAEQEN